jgi:hypothetical protein
MTSPSGPPTTAALPGGFTLFPDDLAALDALDG